MSLAAEALSPPSCIDQADWEGTRRGEEHGHFQAVKFTVTWHGDYAVFTSLGRSKFWE
jgi:hypothetical protein